MYNIFFVAVLSFFLQFSSTYLIPLSPTTLSISSSGSSSLSAFPSSSFSISFSSIPSLSTSSSASSYSSSSSSISSPELQSAPLSSSSGTSGTSTGSSTVSDFSVCSASSTAATSSGSYSTSASILQSTVQGFQSESHSRPESYSSASSILASSAADYPPNSELLTNTPCDNAHYAFSTSTAILSSSASQTSSLTSRISSTTAYKPINGSSGFTYSASTSSWGKPWASTALATISDETLSGAESSLSAFSKGHFTFAGSSLTRSLPTASFPTTSISTASLSTASSTTTSIISSGSSSSTTLSTSTLPLSANALSSAMPFSSTTDHQSTSAPPAGTDSSTGFTAAASSSTIDTFTGSAPTGSLLTAFSSTSSPVSTDAASAVLSALSALIPLSPPTPSPSSAETFVSSKASQSRSSTRSIISTTFGSLTASPLSASSSSMATVYPDSPASSSAPNPATPSSSPQHSSSTSLSPTATLADFANVLCNSGDVGNPAADPSVRWAEAECDDAWVAVTHNWTTVPGAQNLIFVQYVSEYWNGPQQWNCGKMGEDPCGGGPGDCGDMDDEGPIGTPDMPAGWLILQSFTNFHNFQFNQYSAIGGAQAFVVGQIGQFQSAFAPIDDPEAALKIMLDILGIGLSLISAAVWNKVLKDIPFFTAPNDPNNHGWAKDSANAIISQVITLSKDTLPSAQTALGAQNTLSAYTVQLVNQWQNITALYTLNLFSGSSSTTPGITDLTNLMANGSLLNNGVGAQGIYDMQSIMAQTLFGLLIPKAWQTSNEDVNPVILLPENNAQGCPKNAWSDWVSDSTAAASAVCYNNQAYYLFNVAGGPCPFEKSKRDTEMFEPRETGPEALPCPNRAISELPGISTMDGMQWGGVTRDDLVISAVQGYVLNGNKNGYQMPESSNIVSGSGETGDLYFENGIQTPGLTTIPVCTLDVAVAAWVRYGGRSGAKPSGYPCVS